MKYTARGIDIGHLEYAVGPIGASDAVFLPASVVVSQLTVVLYVISVLR